jgi:hypothetical protein
MQVQLREEAKMNPEKTPEIVLKESAATSSGRFTQAFRGSATIWW